MKTFPLLLVFGREYNGTGSVAPVVQEYPFTKLRGPTFWNRTFRLIARAYPEEADLKQLFIDLNSSPLVTYQSNTDAKSAPLISDDRPLTHLRVSRHTITATPAKSTKAIPLTQTGILM